MTDSSMLSAESSPHELVKHSGVRHTGVRRVNNLPLYLVGGAVGTFLLMMVLVGMDRANKSQVKAQAIPQKHGDTTQLVQSITGNRTGGMVPAAVITPPAPLVPAITVPIAMPDDLEMPPLPSRLKATAAGDPMLERIRQQKMQLFESAVKSKTSVPIPELKAHADDSDRRTQTLERIDDANAAFTARLAQLESGDPDRPAAPSNSQRNDLKSFDATSKGDRWQLNAPVEAPETPYTLRAGFVIPATLISGINSDLPGQITAQVSQNVYDTATGHYLLLPQGARLVGSYTSNVAYGQSRVMVAWQRIVFPDGKTLDMGAMPGADSAGYSGFNDIADNHYVRIFGSAILMSGITAGVSMSQNANSNGSFNAQPTASSALSEALGQQLGNVTTQMISKNLSISPTLEIRPGFRFNVMCIKDLVLTKPYAAFDY
jgi:type IV secretory pathway VirB10-like protein